MNRGKKSKRAEHLEPLVVLVACIGLVAGMFAFQRLLLPMALQALHEVRYFIPAMLIAGVGAAAFTACWFGASSSESASGTQEWTGAARVIFNLTVAGVALALVFGTVAHKLQQLPSIFQ